jgi:hypothetical protein
LSIDEARDRPASEVVTLEGPVVIQYGDAMICSGLAESSPPQCEAGLLIGAVSQRFFETEGRREIEDEIEAAETELLRELRGMSARLRELEAAVQGRRST